MSARISIPKISRARAGVFERKLAKAFERIVIAVTAVSGLAGCHTAEEGSASDSGSDEDSSACAPIPIDGSYIEPNAEAGCASFKQLPCGLPPNDAGLRGCYVVDLEICHQQCDMQGLFYCQLAPTVCLDGAIQSDQPVVLECNRCAIAGRRPIGLTSSFENDGAPGNGSLGEYFASMAYLEAASVRAFVDLARWLAELGAPSHLVREAQRSAQDERRHARVTSQFARRFRIGVVGKRRRLRARAVPRPSLLALLENNVVEGCVGEMFGALVVSWQARHATDARVRRAMERIAADETRHAALAWETLAWGIALVSAADRHRAVTRLNAKIDEALAALQRQSLIPVTREIESIAGHPPPHTALRLARAVAEVVRAESKTLL